MSEQSGRLRHVPGEPGLWILILGDMLIFGTFFITFMVYRMQDIASFDASHREMTSTFGIVNTVLLLTSSLFVTKAVGNARSGHTQAARTFLLLAVGCGVLFLICKIFEYHAKITSGITINTNMFFLLYFVFTGLHALHVLIGIGILLLVRQTLTENISATSEKMVFIEGGAVFWHLVDMVWVVLFALFYVMR